MSFNVAASAYDRFMGRYSEPLAPLFADFAGVSAGQRVLDVGCGPGALTAELVKRLEPANVSAVDPSEPFVAAIRDRYPAVTVQHAPAEDLPFADDSFDVAMAQLVVHFMADPVAGLREMSRVAHRGGVVAACVWDHEGGKGPLGLFWDAVSQLDPGARTESGMAGTREGHLVQLFGEAGLTEVEGDTLSISVVHQTFDEWWEPYTLGVGPAGKYVADLDDAGHTRLRELCREKLPPAPFTMTALTWAARGVV
jgi:SAM-dependent methyltransferase